MIDVGTRKRWGLVAVCAALAAAPVGPRQPAALAQGADSGDLSIELVDREVLRVCADPRNLPFSNQLGEGFENKLAQLLADKLQKKLAYTWYPQAPGFVRNTLGGYKCDVIMGFPQGNELVQSTNPYYRTAYALVFRPGTGLDGIETLGDTRLKEKRIGLVAGTPPSNTIAINGLMTHVKPYPLVVDTRYDSSADAMMQDLAAGTIDLGVLWGPMAGYHARRAKSPLAVVPLTHETSGLPLVYRMTMGVRPADQEWKRTLNRFIDERQPAINELLLGFGVPLLDEHNQPITQASLASKP
jgi:quinoprotein dehydrogenase-associated probable ABC transporter substrate-binding protein